MELFIDLLEGVLGGIVNALADPDNSVLDKVVISLVAVCVFAIMIAVAVVSESPIVSIALVVILAAIIVRELWLFARKNHAKKG